MICMYYKYKSSGVKGALGFEASKYPKILGLEISKYSRIFVLKDTFTCTLSDFSPNWRLWYGVLKVKCSHGAGIFFEKLSKIEKKEKIIYSSCVQQCTGNQNHHYSIVHSGPNIGQNWLQKLWLLIMNVCKKNFRRSWCCIVYSKKGPIQQSKGKISHFLIATLKINFWSIVNHQREHKH